MSQRRRRREYKSMMRIVVNVVVCCAAMAWFPQPVATQENANECLLIQPDHDRICGSLNPELLRYVHEIGGCFNVWVKAASKWNATGVRLQTGRTYDFEVVEHKGWADASLKATALGWTSEAKTEVDNAGWLTRTFITLMRPLRRAPNQEWFYLMGMVAEVGDHAFPIGDASSLRVESSGEFCAFANDLPWKYGNNHGALKLRVSESAR